MSILIGIINTRTSSPYMILITIGLLTISFLFLFSCYFTLVCTTQTGHVAIAGMTSSSSSSSHAYFKYLMIFVYKSSPLILYINRCVLVSEN